MLGITDQAIHYRPSTIGLDSVWAVPAAFLRIVVAHEADAATTDIRIVGHHILHDGRQLVGTVKIVLYLRHAT